MKEGEKKHEKGEVSVKCIKKMYTINRLQEKQKLSTLETGRAHSILAFISGTFSTLLRKIRRKHF